MQDRRNVWDVGEVGFTKDLTCTPAGELLPRSAISPALTDEALANPEGFYRHDVREQLLRLAPQWRQTALAEDVARHERWVNGFAARTFGGLSSVVDDILLAHPDARPDQQPAD
jgi:hypothetical protein